MVHSAPVPHLECRLDVPCSANLATYDLETEVFLHILKNCVEYVQVSTPAHHTCVGSNSCRGIHPCTSHTAPKDHVPPTHMSHVT